MMRRGNLIAVTILGVAATSLGVRAVVALTEDRPTHVATAPESSTIVIKGFVFPETLTIQVGGTLTWVNRDGEEHTVTFSDSAGVTPAEMTIEPGRTGSMTFSKIGTYEYSCEIHRSMKGHVEVVAASKQDPYGYG